MMETVTAIGQAGLDFRHNPTVEGIRTVLAVCMIVVLAGVFGVAFLTDALRLKTKR